MAWIMKQQNPGLVELLQKSPKDEELKSHRGQKLYSTSRNKYTFDFIFGKG